MNIRIIIFSLALFSLIHLACEPRTENRKIKLADKSIPSASEQRLTTTIHLEPSLRRAVAVLFFENKTGDENLAWLQKGLSEMLIRSLSQSRSLSVMSSERIFEIIKRESEKNPSKNLNLNLAAIIAEETRVEAILTGSIIKKGDRLQIRVRLQSPNNGLILKEESVEGPGMEAIFTMVDQLSQRIKSALDLTLDQADTGKSLADLSTPSLEAWQHYATGVEYLNQVLYHEAIGEFKKAITLDSTFVDAQLKLANLLFILGELKPGLAVFKKLQHLRPNATPQQQFQIDFLEARVNREVAAMIKISRDWVTQYPDDRDANQNLGDIYFSLQMYDEALEVYKKILTIDPKNKTIYNLLGYVYANKGDLTHALSYLQQYQQLAADEPNPYDSMGEIYLSQGNLEAAEKNFHQALKINPNFTSSIRSLGNVYLEKGDYSQAATKFNLFLKKSADRASKAEGYSQLGTLQMRLGKFDEARKYFETALQYQVNPFRNLLWLEEVYLSKKDTVGMRQAFQRGYESIRKLLPTNPTMMRELANFSLWYDVNQAETIQLLNQYLKTNPPLLMQRWSRYYLALLYMQNHQWAQHRNDYREFLLEFIKNVTNSSNFTFNFLIWRTLGLYNESIHQTPGEGIAEYRRLIDYCKQQHLNLPEMVFRLLLADLYFYRQDTQKALEQLRIVGAPPENKWLISGPFDNHNGFNQRFPPELGIELQKEYREPTQTMRWRHPDDGLQEGYINLKSLYPEHNWKVAYGLIEVVSPREQPVQIRVGSNEALKIWLNGELVWKFNIIRDPIFDDDIVPVTLKTGRNRILIKVCNRLSEWGFYFRITDPQGQGLNDLQFLAADEDLKISRGNSRFSSAWARRFGH
ncbi:tetratricopeptide repeat protein [candidate division KSB1 bacterium]|nr:tetratricopeptide repeat protein [candidate division KSB1 bacterium]